VGVRDYAAGFAEGQENAYSRSTSWRVVPDLDGSGDEACNSAMGAKVVGTRVFTRCKLTKQNVSVLPGKRELY
jgi:hypothetical protein